MTDKLSAKVNKAIDSIDTKRGKLLIPRPALFDGNIQITWKPLCPRKSPGEAKLYRVCVNMANYTIARSVYPNPMYQADDIEEAEQVAIDTVKDTIRKIMYRILRDVKRNTKTNDDIELFKWYSIEDALTRDSRWIGDGDDWD